MKRLTTDQEIKNIMELFYKTIYRAWLFIILVAVISNASTFEAKAKGLNSYSDTTSSGTVAPLAKFKKDAPKMFKMMKMTKQQWVSNLPNKTQLGVPVYPGAVIVAQQQGYSDNGETLLPELILVSPDPISKIETWYSEKLKDWNHIRNYNAFLPPHKIVDVMSDKFDATRHVQREKIMQKHQLDGMFLKQPDNAKTGIIVRY